MFRYVLQHSDQKFRLQLQVDKDGNIPMMNAIESNNLNLCHELLKELAGEQMKITKVWSTKVNICYYSLNSLRMFALVILPTILFPKFFCQ